jgi:biopolymer transport protein ExbB
MINKHTLYHCLVCLLLVLAPPTLFAADMRAAEQAVATRKTELLKQVQAEKQEAGKEALKSRQEMDTERLSLLSDIRKLKRQNNTILAENKKKKAVLQRLEADRKRLQKQREQIDTVSRELIGFMRVNAKDLDALISQSQQSAFIKNRGAFIQRLLKSENYPDMTDIRNMTTLLLEEIQLSGEVRIQEHSLVSRSGEAVITPILVLGNFTTAYRTDEETGFALYSDKSRRLFALSRTPAGSVQSRIERYMKGESITVPIDISQGSALRQISSGLNFVEQIAAGGPVVWPIIGIFFFGLLIVIERLFFLLRRHINAEKLSEQLNSLALNSQWQDCTSLLESYRGKPLAVVLRTALKHRKMKREDIENALQESILGQIPPLERFLSTLGMIASIAPLLGLLGTVTGMINTFHAITYFGTGDAKMMSGGISEALVTTMLGLAVAIPIMFSHTLLSRFVENLIAQMEEKAVAFVNTIEKVKEENDPAA